MTDRNTPARRDFGPRQLAGYLDTFPGQVDRARHLGLIPEPDRGRGRWSAAVADEIRGRWPEISAAVECIGAPSLKQRGWTEAMIRDLLGEPDFRVDNPHYKTAAPRRLWLMRKVEAIEATPEFTRRKDRAARQCAAAARGALTKQVFLALGGTYPLRRKARP